MSTHIHRRELHIFALSPLSLVSQLADTLLLVYAAGVREGEREQLALHCCYSQGLPATFHVIQVRYRYRNIVSPFLAGQYFQRFAKNKL